MSDEQRQTVRTVFGKEIDVSEIEGVDVKTLLAVNTRLMAVESGDPDYEYGWLDTRDPYTSVKLRKGLWELVDPETDPVIAPGALRSNKEYRVNELVLVRMPKAQFRRIRAAKDAIALRRETVVEQSYKDTVKDVSQTIVPDATGEAKIEKTETVRDVPAWAKA